MLFLRLRCSPVLFQVGLVNCSLIFLISNRSVLLIHPDPDQRISVLRLHISLCMELFSILLRYRRSIICKVQPVCIFPRVYISRCNGGKKNQHVKNDNSFQLVTFPG